MLSESLAWTIAMALIGAGSGAGAAMATLSRVVENQRKSDARLAQLWDHLSQGTGQTTYIPRAECEKERQEICARFSIIDARIERLSDQHRENTEIILKAIREIK